MRRVHKIVLQEINGPIIISLLVLTFVVFTREFGRLAQLLIQKSADTTVVFSVVLYLAPSILIFTVPFAFLIGTLIGFSRLSADSEIVALRAGGVSVFQLLRPVVLVGLVVMALTATLTLHFLPAGNWNLRTLRHELRLLPVQSQIKPRVFYEEFPGLVLYIEDIDPQESLWKGILVADTSAEGENRLILAKQGYPLFSPDRRRLQLHFEDGTIFTAPSSFPERDDVSRFGTLDIPVILPYEEEEPVERPKRPEDKTLEELNEDLRTAPPEERHTSLVELNRRLALPIAALIFSVLGVTLGIRSHRGGRGYGFVASIVVAFTYYVLFATGTTLSNNGVLPIPLGVWGANILLGVLAFLSMKYATRETGLRGRLPRISVLPVLSRLTNRLRDSRAKLSRTMSRSFQRWTRILPRFRIGLTRVIDLYMIRHFILYLALTLVVCCALFYLFTFFELINDIFANDVPYAVLFDYFFYLLPYILSLLAPISALIATLVALGSLERTNQIVAFKSCGLSIFRIAAPIFISGALLSGVLFVSQEYVLPYANQKQDNLRNNIKGRPIQTIMPGRNWIFGTDDRLYYYDYFDSERNMLAGLSVFQLDIGEGLLFTHIRGQRARWDPYDQTWILEHGWQRDFQSESLDVFEVRSFPFPEEPQYFGEEVQGSSKMTYLQLREYIEDLQRGGFEVEYLETELYKKLSFPLVTLIMTVLGVPFSLTMGRKGALYGIAAGVLIGIIYWGAFGVFDVLGSNGLLAPLLAAWGPNILFGTGAVLLLSGVKT